MSQTTNRLTALALGLALAAGVAAAPTAPAIAADGQQLAQSSGSTQTAQSYSDAKLQAFAQAAVKVSEARRAWAPKIRKAQQQGNKQEAQKMADQATQEMRTQIEGVDNISVQEYRQIAKAAQNDKQLAKKLSGMVKSKMQGQQGQ
jgi:hypothetical protein